MPTHFNRPRPSTRAGVFGANRAGQQDRAAFGAQRAINASQGRVLGGNRRAAFGPTRMQRAQNSQRQLFSQRVSSLRGRTRTPTPRLPLQRAATQLQAQVAPQGPQQVPRAQSQIRSAFSNMRGTAVRDAPVQQPVAQQLPQAFPQPAQRTDLTTARSRLGAFSRRGF